jgi:hypothetical protein
MARYLYAAFGPCRSIKSCFEWRNLNAEHAAYVAFVIGRVVTSTVLLDRRVEAAAMLHPTSAGNRWVNTRSQ